jgi:hypothetical protein
MSITPLYGAGMSMGSRHRKRAVDAAFTRGSVLVAVRLPAPMRTELKRFCDEREQRVSQVIRMCLRNELRAGGYLR